MRTKTSTSDHIYGQNSLVIRYVYLRMEPPTSFPVFAEVPQSFYPKSALTETTPGEAEVGVEGGEWECLKRSLPLPEFYKLKCVPDGRQKHLEMVYKHN